MTPARLAGIYLVLAILWIVVSDIVLNWWLGEPSAPLEQIIKGCAFVSLSAGVMWLVLHNYMRALQHSEKRYRMVVDTVREGLIVLDRSAHVRYVNPQIGNLLNRDLESLLNRPIQDFVAPEFVDDLNRRLEQRWRGEADQYETQLVRSGGERLWVIVTTNPIFDEAGNVTGALGMITDISQRVAAEQKLRDSERRYRDLAASRKLLLNELDHRVKNNLAGLHALLSMYARRAGTVEDFAEFMRQKLVAMTTVHEMVAAANWEAVRFHDLIRRTSSQFRGPENDGVDIEVNGPVVTVAPRQAAPLIMILHELMTNSRKHGAYSQPGGRIKIAWELDEPRGDGERIGFRLDWRESGGPSITEPITPGLGLGLVKGFAEHELNGRVAFEADSEGLHCTIEGGLDTEAEDPDAGDQVRRPAIKM